MVLTNNWEAAGTDSDHKQECDRQRRSPLWHNTSVLDQPQSSSSTAPVRYLRISLWQILLSWLVSITHLHEQNAKQLQLHSTCSNIFLTRLFIKLENKCIISTVKYINIQLQSTFCNRSRMELFTFWWSLRWWFTEVMPNTVFWYILVRWYKFCWQI